MNVCRQMRDRFDERLDGRLSAADQAAFDSHVESCAGCREQWQAYAAAWQVVARLPAVEPSFGFAERTLRRLQEPPETRERMLWIPVWRWAAAAALALVLGLGVWVGESWHDARRASRSEAVARLYEQVRDTEFLEDFDVIASLDTISPAEQGDL